MSKIRLQAATEENESIILKWSNDPVTRKMSFNTMTISKKEHAKWFSFHSKSPSSRLFIAFNDQDVPIGICRFQRLNSNTWETGINLDPEYRGKRLGAIILHSACRKMKKDYADCKIIAHTRPENIPFRSIAKQAGFIETGTTSVNDQPAIELMLT